MAFTYLRPGLPSIVSRGILRTSRQLRKRKAACAQLQLVPTDGENFRRGGAGMSATHPTLRMLFVIRRRKFVSQTRLHTTPLGASCLLFFAFFWRRLKPNVILESPPLADL